MMNKTYVFMLFLAFSLSVGCSASDGGGGEVVDSGTVTDIRADGMRLDRAVHDPVTENDSDDVNAGDREELSEPYDAADTQDSGTAVQVDAMTFNIRYGTANDGDNSWDNRRDLVFQVIDARGADFVGLQEAWPFQTEQILAAVSGYAFIGVSRLGMDDAGEACPILYRTERWQLDEDENGTFWLSETPDVVASRSWDAALPRIATWGRFTEIDSGTSLYVVNTHFDHQGATARRESAELIIEWVTARRYSDPVVVMSDFNARDDSPPLLAFTGGATEMVDAFRALNSDPTVLASSGTFHGFTGNGGDNRIDYVMTLPEARLISAHILRDSVEGRYPSDHFPVAVRFEP